MVARHVQGAKDFIIQAFKPDVTLNTAFSRIRPFSPDRMDRIKANVSDIMSGVSVGEKEHRPELSIAGRTDQDNLYS